MRQQWTMRFEAKHSYFKKLTQNIGNFINLPYTLALRHEKYQCYYRMNVNEYRDGIVDVGPGNCIMCFAQLPFFVHVHCTGIFILSELAPDDLDHNGRDVFRCANYTGLQLHSVAGVPQEGDGV